MSIIEYKNFNYELAKHIDSLIQVLNNTNYNFSNANQALKIIKKPEIENTISEYFKPLENGYSNKAICTLEKNKTLI